MPSFGTASRQRLDTCHPDLIQVCELAIKNYDFTVLEGFRSNARQDELFRQGKSKLRAGQSKHNSDPSRAVDLAPWPIDWEDARRFYYLQGVIKQAAAQLGVKIRQGCDWDGDGSFSDQTFHDLPHVELVDE